MTRRDLFVYDLVVWLNRRLVPAGVIVTADAPLFEGGLIDSLKILRLIAWTERAIGATIPDEQISMDNFRTVRTIAEVFVTEAAHVDV